jgi:hypothetical protein
MYDKVIHSPGGLADMLSPIEFQQQFSLPLVGTNSVETYNGNPTDQYAAAAGVDPNDPYSQWASSYGQWPQSKD